MRQTALAIFTAAALLATTANAASMRCGNSVVTDGTEEVAVNMKCGSPIYTSWEVIQPWGVVKKAIYDMGKDRFTEIVLFSDGKVVDIREGPRN